MTENSKANLTLYVEDLSLSTLEGLANTWLNEPTPTYKPECKWCETPKEFYERKHFILLLVISKKLDIYETEYILSDI